MEKFLRKTTLFIIPILLGLVFCEHFLRKIPNDYSFKNEWLSNNARTIQVLNMGSSHAFYGIEPNLFSCKAFNAAHVSQSIKYDHFIFSKFVNDMDSLKVLVLPISYFSFTSFGPEKGLKIGGRNTTRYITGASIIDSNRNTIWKSITIYV